MAEYRLNTMSFYSSYSGEVSGSFSVTDGSTTINHKLSDEDASRLKAFLIGIIEDNRHKIAADITGMKPPAMLEYDSSRTIDADSSEIPF